MDGLGVDLILRPIKSVITGHHIPAEGDLPTIYDHDHHI